MSRTCAQCGKKAEGEDVIFCPYCGARLETIDNNLEICDKEAEKWVKKALAVTSFPERKKILLKGLEECPGSREIEWELLFIGEPQEKRPRGIDFSIIKSWILEIYLKPKEFSDEKRDRMRSELYDAPQLKKTLSLFDDPDRKQQEYLRKLCREYVELFLEGSNVVMGNIFGFRIERNKEKKLAVPVAEMIAHIRADEKLLPEQREQLWKAMYEAYGARTGGNTAYLDELISKN